MTAYLTSLKPLGMRFDLDRMRAVMSAFGDPQDAFPSIHVAGTNGKGSVTAMLASILRGTGRRVGLYTSPHLENVRERFQINGTPIPAAEFRRWASRLRRFLAQRRRTGLYLTEFEFLTAVAFLWFRDRNVDVAVVETGLGGRLDATNVMNHKLLTVITNIDFDHMDWLGKRLENIAFEKAGILRPRVPVVTGASGAAWDVIRRRAEALHAPLLRARSESFRLRLAGAHQQANAALAAAAARTLHIPERLIRRGLAGAEWPGRFEEFHVGGTRVILDGAHNPAAVRTLIRTLRERKHPRVRLLFAALRDKDVQAMAAMLSPLCERVVTVPVASDRSSDPARLARLKEWRGKAEAARSVEAGWAIISRLPSKRPILVAGSLYLVGAVRARIQKEPK